MKWYFKQLLPLTYRSKYGECMPDGTVRPHSVVWKMWLGRSFHIEDCATEDRCIANAWLSTGVVEA